TTPTYPSKAWRRRWARARTRSRRSSRRRSTASGEPFPNPAGPPRRRAMHDELTERRLRSALREAGDGLSFTITAAELERRMALRGRRSGNSRLTLLLAAAVAIGAL